MSGAAFPVLCILVVLAGALIVAAHRLAGVIAHEITMRRLARICGSRARANRLVRAVELETRNNALSSLAASSVQSRAQASAAAVGRPASKGVPGRIGPTFPQLMFAQRQAD